MILCCLGIAIFGVSEVPDVDAMAFESETAAVSPTTNFQDASTTAQPPIVLAMNPTDTMPYQSSSAPKADEEIGTAEDLSTTLDGSSQRNTATEIRELD